MSTQEPQAQPVVITLPDGSQKSFPGPVTGLEIARSIGEGLAKASYAVKVNGKTQDLNLPITADSQVSLITSRDAEALEILRHSCTHMMAQAVKRLYPNAYLEDGPPTEEGFWYDIKTVPPIGVEDFPRIEAEMEKIANEALEIRRREITRSEARELFAARNEKYKLDLIERIPEGDTISVYAQGEFVDLCRGPHLPHTGFLKNFKLLSVAGAYWKGDSRNDQLTRIRGTAFPDKKGIKEYLEIQEEAKKRDHRKLGKELGLFMHHEWAAGETIWLPKGKVMYDVLKRMSSDLHLEQDYQEVFTPMLFRKDLFETSGHWKHYRDDMFIVPGQEARMLTPAEVVEWSNKFWNEIKDQKNLHEELVAAKTPEERLTLMLEPRVCPQIASKYWQVFEKRAGEFILLSGSEGDVAALKPMNCPCHMLIFGDRRRSYRELPLRISDQGVLHRNEASGTLSGLTRVRQFCQDDAHIFVSEDMIAEEITRVIAMVRRVYKAVDMEFANVFLSTKPAKAMGTQEQWDRAEAALKQAIEANGMEYKINEGDGAFYGPKIDFIVRDCLKREFQVATIQLDYQLPSRFNLRYTTSDGGEAMPVVVHRALYGSFERFIGILIEHFAGAFPTWLAPEQVRVMSLSEKYITYAREVTALLKKAGIRATLDAGDEKVGAKIRDAQMQKIPYMLILGEQEQNNRTVAVRSRSEGDQGAIPIEQFLAKISAEATLSF
ncbi:MAG: threonine--tRNA ligase [Candidatus Sumerlaeia bacterium]|nr:threonine--tRNA ligase [Candidatus Sumerlaeia bacterium]